MPDHRAFRSGNAARRRACRRGSRYCLGPGRFTATGFGAGPFRRARRWRRGLFVRSGSAEAAQQGLLCGVGSPRSRSGNPGAARLVPPAGPIVQRAKPPPTCLTLAPAGLGASAFLGSGLGLGASWLGLSPRALGLGLWRFGLGLGLGRLGLLGLGLGRFGLLGLGLWALRPSWARAWSSALSAPRWGFGFAPAILVPSTTMAAPQCLHLMRTLRPRTFASGTAYRAGQFVQETSIRCRATGGSTRDYSSGFRFASASFFGSWRLSICDVTEPRAEARARNPRAAGSNVPDGSLGSLKCDAHDRRPDRRARQGADAHHLVSGGSACGAGSALRGSFSHAPGRGPAR